MSTTTVSNKTPYGEKVRKFNRRHERTLPSPMSMGVDGIDHINVGDDATTVLGRLMNHRAEFSFNHTHFGRFRTMEGYNLWLLSEKKDDRLRQLSGLPLRSLSKKISKHPETIPNFKAMIMDGYYQRIIQSEDLKRAICESTLPFEIYYVLEETKIRVRPARYTWLLYGLEEIRKALKDDRPPHFNSLVDCNRRKKGIYDDMVAMIQNQSTANS